MSQATTIDIDIAKQVFQIHGVDVHGKCVLRRRLSRSEFSRFFANLPACLIGIEAGRSAHHWARLLAGFGHDVRLMPPQYVKPYVKTNKNDAVDAEAICEAVTRPTMRFVPTKTVDQQAILSIHRARDGLVRMRTAQANQIRGLLGEFGIAVRAGIAAVVRASESAASGDDDSVPAMVRPLLRTLVDHIRQLAAWLGLVPRQHASGGRERLLGISKRGNVYLRTLLIHGARSVASRAASCPPTLRAWLDQLKARRHANVAVVALANKMARTIWALLARNEVYAAAAG